MSNPVILRPSTTALSFIGFDRALHPELFECLQHRTLEREGVRLLLGLTRAGHILAWQYEQVTLTEVLADESQTLPESRQFFAHRIGGERVESFSSAPGVSYQTCFQLEKLPPQLYGHLHDELVRDGTRDGVLHVLGPHDRLGLSPLSYLDVQTRPGSILVHAFHTYPDEFAIVKTQTLIERV